MADQSFLQRGLQGFRDTMRELRTGEGKGGAAAIGRSAKKAAKGVKGGLGRIKRAFGFSYVDAYNEDIEEQRRRKRARQFMGDDEPEYVGVRTQDPKRDLSTVAPEFRAQVSSGLAAANSMTTGSTLVDGGKGGNDDGGDGRW